MCEVARVECCEARSEVVERSRKWEAGGAGRAETDESGFGGDGRLEVEKLKSWKVEGG